MGNGKKENLLPTTHSSVIAFHCGFAEFETAQVTHWVESESQTGFSAEFESAQVTHWPEAESQTGVGALQSICIVNDLWSVIMIAYIILMRNGC